MAIKSFTPFKKGGLIQSDDWNTTFQTNGLQGTIEGVVGEQVSKEGITLDVCNKGLAATADGVSGGGAPHYFGRKTDFCQVDHIIQTTGETIVANNGGFTPLTVSWTGERENLQVGDLIVVEFVGTLDTVQYCTESWNVGGSLSNTVPPGTPSDYFDKYYSSLRFVLNTDGTGAIEEPGFASHCIHYFSPWQAKTEAAGLLENGLVYTKGTYGFDGARNGGPGFALDFHMLMVYSYLGTETSLNFQVAAKPGAGPGSQDGAFAPPAMKIYSGSTLYSYVIRRGN
jgi:hypothetical protein